MGRQRLRGRAAILAGAIGLWVTAMPPGALASDQRDVLQPDRILPVQLLRPSAAMTEAEAKDLLRSEGFEVVQSGRTLLGRIRIVAESPEGRREIVLHPGDGRVMRDLFTEAEGRADGDDDIAADARSAATGAVPDAGDAGSAAPGAASEPAAAPRAAAGAPAAGREDGPEAPGAGGGAGGGAGTAAGPDRAERAPTGDAG